MSLFKRKKQRSFFVKNVITFCSSNEIFFNVLIFKINGKQLSQKSINWLLVLV